MSRSTRHSPIFGRTSAECEKAFKSAEHRRERAAVRSALIRGIEYMPSPLTFGYRWNGPKDGKCYVGNAAAEVLRK